MRTLLQRVIVSIIFGFAVLSSPLFAAEIKLTPNADYFGFDFLTLEDVSQKSCAASCLENAQCRAFTYNVSARFCFLKSDFSALQRFEGAVAGRVIDDTQQDVLSVDPLDFIPSYLFDEVRNLKQTVAKAEPVSSDVGFGALIAAAASAGPGNAQQASNWLFAALRLDPAHAPSWRNLSVAQLGALQQNNQNRYLRQQTATSAAIISYQTATSLDAQAQGLAVLAQALTTRGLFRPALESYKASLAAKSDPMIALRFQDLRRQYGFRVVDHTVDSDSQTPRICVQFSEPLVKKGVEYTRFLSLDGLPPESVDVSGQQLCIPGLTHSTQYRVTVRSGLPAAIGESIDAPVPLEIYIPDRRPSARFVGTKFVLPRLADNKIPLVTNNTDRVELQVHRVGERSLTQLLGQTRFLKQLSQYELSDTAATMGEPVWRGDLSVTSAGNVDVTTAIPIADVLPDRTSGLYILSARAAGDRSEPWRGQATQWFVISDLGLSTVLGNDGLTVYARSLQTGSARSDASLTLLARNNAVLGEMNTDEKGFARFAAGLTRGQDGRAPAALLARQGNDFVFIDLTAAGFDFSDRGVAGRAPSGPLDVYAFADRGIYRPGEKVHATALARDHTGTAIADLPLTFVYYRPDSVEFQRQTLVSEELGGYNPSMALPDNAMRGTWRMAVFTDPKQAAIAEKLFLVEDFVPDRIDFELQADTAQLVAGVATPFQIEGRYLYGAPAAGLQSAGEVEISTTRRSGQYPGYQFGLADEEPIGRQFEAIGDAPTLDDDGTGGFSVRLGNLPDTSQLLNADVIMRLRENGGRAVERRLSLPVQSGRTKLGVKPEFSLDELSENSDAGFNILALDANGQPIALEGVRWSLSKVSRQYQWYRIDNRWRYEPIEYSEQIADGTVDVSAEEPAKLSVPVAWGRYRLDVESKAAEGPAASLTFSAGWFVDTVTTETPDALDIGLDKAQYQAGDTARVTVNPQFGGDLLVTVGTDSVVYSATHSMSADGGVIEIPVSPEWGAGAYVSATLFRPGNASPSRLPSRAIGVTWLALDQSDRTLDVAVDLPDAVLPDQRFDLPVTITGLAPGETGYVAVSLVDVGILNLTKHKAPDPVEWYFGQRQMGLEVRDIYGRLIDASGATSGVIRTGGDGPAGLESAGSPPTQKLLALYSGLVELDDNGQTTISFDVPAFNGTGRLSIVAWSADAVGASQQELVISDPMVITASAPRFLAIGDRAKVLFEIANVDSDTSAYNLEFGLHGPVRLAGGVIPNRVNLTQGESVSFVAPVDATGIGVGELVVRLTSADGEIIERWQSIPVRPPTHPITTLSQVSIAAGGSLTINDALLSDLELAGSEVTISVAKNHIFDVPALLMGLDRYPYGCAEQTTSRALPLLYLSDLDDPLADNSGVNARIDSAIERLLSFQTSTGSFGLWGPGYDDLWLDAYIGDFLTRAREKGFAVPELAMLKTLENLQNTVAYNGNNAERGNDLAYALYVLARNRKASAGDLRYYADAQSELLRSPLAKAQLAAALALYGDGDRADRLFNSAYGQLERMEADARNRNDFGSNLRDGAAVLALAVEANAGARGIADMMSYVSASQQTDRSPSTQELAWLVMAARANAAADGDLALTVGGDAISGAYRARLSGDRLIGGPVTVENGGDGAVSARITAVAAPKTPRPAESNGFELSRRYYTLAGDEADISAARQNDRFVVVLDINESNAWTSRVVVSDLLPAGFEIDNPRIVSSANLAKFSWLGGNTAAHAEFKDDRFVAAFNRTASSERRFRVSYIVRAVTPGEYAHPAARVEDMYRPDLFAQTDAGVVAVTGYGD